VAPHPVHPTFRGRISPYNGQVWWAWGMDTDPNTAPLGYPAPPLQPIPVEIGLRVKWDGTAFSGEMVDRRPLLTGGNVIVTQVPFSITSNHVSLSLRASDVGDPTSFLWDATTILRSGPDVESGWLNADGLDPFFSPWP
jgi:hypothetical protein